MDPLELMKLLGFSFAELASAIPFERSLRSLGLKSPDYSRFLYELSREPIAGLSIPTRLAFKVANYLAFQGEYLGMLDPTKALEYRLAEVTGRRPDERAGEANYRYDVAITVRFPSSGDEEVKYVSVDSPTPISPQEAEARAWEQFVRDIGFDTLPGGGGEPREYFDPSVSLVGFYRLAGS